MFRGMKCVAVPLVFAFAFMMTAWAQETQSPESAKTPLTASSTPDNVLTYSYEKSPERYYRLEFRVLETSAEGKVVNSRSYNELVVSGSKSSTPSVIRSGDKVPVVTGSYTSGNGVSNQYESYRVATDIDVHNIAVFENTLRLNVNADISAISSAAPASPTHPIARSTRWDSNVIVPIGRPTVIFSSDNNAGGGRTELELSAVPLDQQARSSH